MQTLFLDFDGVLFDTLKEAYILCRKVFCKTDIFEPIEPEIYERFFRYKFLVYNIWQYYYLIQAVQQENVEFEFNRLVANRDIEAEARFERDFVGLRVELLEQYPDFVDSLESPFPFWDMVQNLQGFDIVVVSRKNSFAIRRRIGDRYKIIGKEELEHVVDKAEFIREYIAKNNVERAFFVDDNSHNLRPCEGIERLTCLLAGWGNIAIGESGMSAEEIIKFFTVTKK